MSEKAELGVSGPRFDINQTLLDTASTDWPTLEGSTTPLRARLSKGYRNSKIFCACLTCLIREGDDFGLADVV